MVSLITLLTNKVNRVPFLIFINSFNKHIIIIHYGNINAGVMFMLKKITLVLIIFIVLITPKVVLADGFKYVEIFDPKQDKVVKVVPLSTEIYNMASTLIRNIDGIYGKNDPVTEDGYAIKIPLNPSIKVDGKWLNALINEIYIIIPENNPPFLMIFEDKNRLSCFPFNGDIDKLSKVLDFNLKSNFKLNLKQNPSTG